jgi:hypothetical protein
MFMSLYYAIYLGCCAVVIAALGFVFHRSGAVFLNNAFAGNHTLARAVGRLLDMGYYMLSLGFLGLSCSASSWDVRDAGAFVQTLVSRLGGLLLTLAVGHTFNLLILALLRSRSATRAGTL